MIETVSRKAYLAARLVADTPEHDGAERSDGEAGPERRQCAQELGGRVAGKEDRSQEDRQDGIEIEVVPLDHRADCRGADDERDLVVVCASVGRCL